MRSLVLGGTRFFGLDVVRRLAAAGDEVTVLSRRPPPPDLEGRVEIVTADRDSPAARALLATPGRFDVLFDNIAMTGRDVEATLDAARGFEGRYVLTSTGSVYLDDPAGRMFREDEARILAGDRVLGDSPATAYALGKRAAERALMVHGRGVRWTIVRPTIVFGPDDPTDRLRRVANSLVEGRRPDPGEFVFNPIYSGDLTDLLVHCLRGPIAPHSILNAAGADTLSLDELTDRLREILAVSAEPPSALREPSGPAPLPASGRFELAIDRARHELGFEPTPIERWLPPVAWSHRRPSTWPESPRLAMTPVGSGGLDRAQTVHESVPGYRESCGLPAPVPPDAARAAFRELPPGFPRQRKFHLLLQERASGRTIGLADYLDGYPEPGVGWLGLLLIAAPEQGRGYGREAWEALSAWARTDRHAREVRLGVAESNPRALRFWTAAGFREIDRRPASGSAIPTVVLSVELE